MVVRAHSGRHYFVLVNFELVSCSFGHTELLTRVVPRHGPCLRVVLSNNSSQAPVGFLGLCPFLLCNLDLFPQCQHFIIHAGIRWPLFINIFRLVTVSNCILCLCLWFHSSGIILCSPIFHIALKILLQQSLSVRKRANVTLSYTI